MNISLTPQLEAYIRNKVESGSYTTASEVVREALRLLQEQDAYREMRLEELRKEVAKGLKDIEEGRVETFDKEELKRLGRERLEELRKEMDQERNAAS